MKALLDKKNELEGLLNELKLSGHPILEKKAKAYAKQLADSSLDKEKPVDIDPKKLIEALQKLSGKILDIKLNYNGILKLKTIVLSMKIRVDAVEARKNEFKDTELKDIKLEWDVLKKALDSIDKKMLVNARNEINGYLEAKEEKKAIERFEKLVNEYGEVKELFTALGKGIPPNNKIYEQLEKSINELRGPVFETSDDKLKYRIVYPLKIEHTKSTHTLHRKDDIIERLEDKLDKKLAIYNANDLLKLEKDLEKVKKKLKDRLENIVEKTDITDLSLPIYLKKIKTKAGQSAWIIDKAKAPAISKSKGAASLSITPVTSIKIEQFGNVIVSRLTYEIKVKRNAFTYKKFHWGKFGVGVLEAISKGIIAIASARRALVTYETTNTNGVESKVTKTTAKKHNYTGAKVLEHTGKGLSLLLDSFKDRNVGENNDSFTFELALEWDLSNNKPILKPLYKGDLGTIQVKGHHVYANNMHKAFESFEKDFKAKKIKK